MINSNNYQLYPRGFLGKVVQSEPPKQRTRVQEIYDRLQYNANIFIPNGVQIPYNGTIAGIYDLHIRSAFDTMTFEYREKVLATALDAFGTNNFCVWISLQKHSPNFGKTQLAFIADCLKYLKTGERDLSPENWIALINAGAEIECNKTIQDILRDFEVSLAGIGGNEGIVTVKDVVKRWCSKYNGLNDLVLSLNIFFGN